MYPAPVYLNWTKADANSVIQLTAITGAPGNLWPFPASALPLNIAQGFPTNIRDCYVSGYITPQQVRGGVSAIGELLFTRDHDKTPESGKAYVYVIGIDEQATPYFRGPYKPYPDHYYNQQSGVPVEKLFGRVNLTNLDSTRV